MAISAQYLIDQTRLLSGLRNNRLWSDSQILSSLTDGFHDLRDKMIVAGFAHWFRASQTFTLADGEGNNVFDLTTLDPPLEMVQGIDFLDSSGNAFTVDMLPSFANRNAYNSAAPLFGGPMSFSGYLGKNYLLDGDSLFMLPAANAAGNYRCIYTPQAESFDLGGDETFDIGTGAFLGHNRQIPIVIGDHVDMTSKRWTFANGDFVALDVGTNLLITSSLNSGTWLIESVIDSHTVTSVIAPIADESFDPNADDAQNDDVFQYSFPLATFTDEMEGGTIVIAFGAGPPDNTAANGTFTIYKIISPTTLQIRLWAPAFSLTGPTEGSIEVTWQPTGTINTLPTSLVPWYKYIVLFASLAIRASRRQPAGDLELQFQQISARVVALTKQRSEGVAQAPLTRTGFAAGRGGGWGWGG